jgi:Fe-S cluster biogenesis protein NfuA
MALSGKGAAGLPRDAGHTAVTGITAGMVGIAAGGACRGPACHAARHAVESLLAEPLNLHHKPRQEKHKLAGILWCTPPAGCDDRLEEIHAIIVLPLGFPGVQ